MKLVLGALVVLLLIAHQDNWNWENPTLVGGILPVGLAYHAGLSVTAAVVWFLATIFVWPSDNVSAEERSVSAHQESTRERR